MFDSYDDITSPPELPEPEAALLLVACGIGLLTGGSIVAFNWVIHEIRDLADLTLPVPVMPGARALAVPSAWPNLLAIPVIGALVVGVLRAVMDWLEAQQRVAAGIRGVLCSSCTTTRLHTQDCDRLYPPSLIHIAQVTNPWHPVRAPWPSPF